MLKKNLIANYLGQGWVALMGLAFIPLYIKYLGIEAYGLIGLFAVLQAWLSLLDMGMTPMLGREMARFTGGGHTTQSIADLLRSVELIAVAIAFIIALGIFTISGWLANDWLIAEKLPRDMIAQAFSIIGVVTALRVPENIYRSCLVGLQQQLHLNVAISFFATLRWAGSAAALATFSPTVEMFFIWQGAVSILTVGTLAGMIHKLLPTPPRQAKFSRTALLGVWRFSAGMMGITLLGLLLSQIDKILLSKLLTLSEFGYYSIALMAANSLHLLLSPVIQTYSPLFARLVAVQDLDKLSSSYHKATQLLTVVMGTAAITISVHSEEILTIWTGDRQLAHQAAPLLSILAIGTMVNGLMHLPYQLQIAYGWTSLSIRLNLLAVVITAPLIMWVVPRFGSLGAAWVWTSLNAFYATVCVVLVHRRLLCGELFHWYVHDIALPLILASGITVILGQLISFSFHSKAQVILGICLSGMLAFLAAAMSAQEVRSAIFKFIPKERKSHDS